MGFKKKKNVIVLTLCMIISFILYQLYFFFTITSEVSNNQKIVPVFNHADIKASVHMKSKEDKFINSNGVLKGVPITSMQKFRPNSNNEFKCLTLEQLIPFDQVNDDYCDCEDGTDEPSTSACSKGVFHCDIQNLKKFPRLQTVPSSKVNDGICDCCDGSDEWLHKHTDKILTQASSQHYRYYSYKCLNVC